MLKCPKKKIILHGVFMVTLSEFTIPPLPENLISCISYMYKESFNYDVLVKKISSDTGLSEKIFTTANSQFYAQGGPATDNLKQAIIRIGSTNLLKLLTNQYYEKTFTHVDIGFFTLKDFNRHSSYVSQLAVTLAQHLNIQQTNDLMIAGLFHDVGLIARSQCQHTIMKNIVNRCKQDHMDFFSAERAEMAVPHDSLGKQIVQKWNLNERVCYLISNHHHHNFEDNKLKNIDASLILELDILTFADTLAHRMKFTYDHYARDTKVSQQFLDRIGLSIDVIAKKTNEAFKAVSSLAF